MYWPCRQLSLPSSSATLCDCQHAHMLSLRHSTVDEGDSDAQSDLPDVAKFKGQTLDRQVHEDTFFRTKQGYTTNWGPVGFKKSKHPLSIMVSMID